MGSEPSATAAVRTADRPPQVVFGPFAFDPVSRILRRGEAELALPPRVLGVLEVLLGRPGDVVPRQTLIDFVWKDSFVTDTSLAEAVSVLRQTLGDDSQSPVYVQTVHRRGYRFVAPVAHREADPRGGRAASAETGPVGESDAVSPSIAWQLVPWSAAAICAVAAILAIGQLVGRTTPQPVTVRFAVGPPAGTSFDRGASSLAIARDGTQIAWSGCNAQGCRVYLRRLSELEPHPLAGTDGGRMPFFSPDGLWLGFFADGRLKKVAIGGGAATVLADAPEPAGGAWLDREIVFAPSAFSGLVAVPAGGGEPTTLTRPNQAAGEVRHGWPSAAVRDLLFFTIQKTRTTDPSGDLAVLSLASRPRPPWRTLVAGIGLARAASSDLIVFSRNGGLEAVLFDPVRLAVASEPRAVAGGSGPGGAAAHFALSDSGSIVYATGARGRPMLAWWTPAKPAEAGRDLPELRDVALAPDGTRLAAVLPTGDRDDVWIAELERGATTRVTHSSVNAAPAWAPDGRTLFYAARTSGVFETWSRAPGDDSPSVRVYAGDRHSFPAGVSPDGRTLAFIRSADGAQADIWLLPLGGGEARPVVAGPFDEVAPAFSPRSDLLAYQSAESGRWEVYVRRLDSDDRVVVSTEGGTRPFWSADGASLFFQSGDRLMRAGIAAAGTTLAAAANETVAPLDGRDVVGMAADGRLLLASNPVGPTGAIVALDWIREVRQLLGPPQAAMPR